MFFPMLSWFLFVCCQVFTHEAIRHTPQHCKSGLQDPIGNRPHEEAAVEANTDSHETESGSVDPATLISVKFHSRLKNRLKVLQQSENRLQTGYEFLHQMWQKPLVDETEKSCGGPKLTASGTRKLCYMENPLLRILGDPKKIDILTVTPSKVSGLSELLNWNPPNEPPADERLFLYSVNNEWPQKQPDGQGELGSSPGDATKIPCTTFSCQDGGQIQLQSTKERTIVIGNGGFGGSGGIKFLAEKYNYVLKKDYMQCKKDRPKVYEKECTDFLPVNFVWFGADSNQNMRAIDKVDLAITYEPVLEEKLIANGLVTEVAPMFVNYFGFCAPISDPLNLKGFMDTLGSGDPGPVIVMMYIVIKGVQHALQGKGKTYSSRFNFSACGLRDHFLMLVACQFLARMMCSDEGAPEDYMELNLNFGKDTQWIYLMYTLVKRMVADGLMNLMAGHTPEVFMADADGKTKFCDKRANGPDELYLLWHDVAVGRHRSRYPGEIFQIAMREGTYHINDMSFIPKLFGSFEVGNPGKCQIGALHVFGDAVYGCWYQSITHEARTNYFMNPLANPADLLLSARNALNTPAVKFFNWVKTNRLQPQFWDGFKPFRWAVDNVDRNMVDFGVVSESAARWMKLGETPNARESRAALYFWSSGSFEDSEYHNTTSW